MSPAPKLVNILALLAIAYLLLCGALYVWHRSLVYFPTSRSENGRTLVLPLAGETVLASTLPHDGPDAALYFGGNAEDVSWNLPELASTVSGRALYLLHYRGFSGSTGSPTEKALIGDVLALYDLARERHANITVIGRSLGSGVAVQLAAQRPVARLILVTPFDSLQEIAKGQFPFVPVSLLLIDKYESWRYVASISAPTLIIAAEHDEIILRARFPNTFVVIPGHGAQRHLESPCVLAGSNPVRLTAWPCG